MGPQWVTTYSHHQQSHYHPATHEVKVVLSSPVRIRWGAANDPYKHIYGSASEDGMLSTDVEAGDLFAIPAGVAHGSYDRHSPSSDAQ